MYFNVYKTTTTSTIITGIHRKKIYRKKNFKGYCDPNYLHKGPSFHSDTKGFGILLKVNINKMTKHCNYIVLLCFGATKK